MKPLTTAQVAEPIFNFLQLGFAGINDPSEVPFERRHADKVLVRVASGKPLHIKDAITAPAGERRALRELLMQYVMFLTMFEDLVFPTDFLNGTDETQLGKDVLAYVAKHQWPFPQQLPWSANA